MATAKLPASDSGLLAWANHFSREINLTPEAFGLSILQAADFQSLCSDYAAQLLLCDPSTRCKVNVAGKNEIRAKLKKSARLLASIIQGQANVSNSQKTELNLTVRAQPTKAPPPADPPSIRVESVSGLTARVRIADKVTPRRGRPPGTDGVILFSFVGDEPPTNRVGWKLELLTAQRTVNVTFAAGTAPGTRVWFSAQWFNSRKQTGPASPPIATNLPGGAPLPTELSLAA